MKPTAPFTPAEAAAFLAFADSVLAQPPAHPWIERHPGRGRLVLRFALPLDLLRTEDCGRRFARVWRITRQRSAVLAAMAGQMCDQLRSADGSTIARLGWCKHGRGVIPTWPEPLPGRPMVRAIRFSSVAPDACSGWQKLGIDCLLMPRIHAGHQTAALGVLRDDRPAVLEVREWHEEAPRGGGGCVIEVWSGEEIGDGQA